MRVRPVRISTTHVERIGEELCIYDWSRHVVHTLNEIAGSVWLQCDGRTTFAELSARLDPDLTDGARDALLSLTLRELDAAHLLVPVAAEESAPFAASRRDVLKRVGAAAILPVITSIVAPTPVDAQSASSRTFDYTGAGQVFTVPAGVTRVTIAASGAAGGSSIIPGGKGGLVTASLPVTAGETLSVFVGGAGPDRAGFGPPLPSGGFNGGGGSAGSGAGGGGASDVRRASTKLIVSGGGGGTGTQAWAGGDGGGTIAANGQGGFTGGGGGGGTGSAGGTAGTAGANGTAGTPGSAGTGGSGGQAPWPNDPTLVGGGGGGGGGFFGGGGGGGGLSISGFPSVGSGGGGGGSSYTDPAATGVIHTPGVRSGHGVIVISWV